MFDKYHELAPIVLFVYNRPFHTQQTLEALSLNELADQSHLYIYSDGPKANAKPEDVAKINEVRQVIRSKKWCKQVEIIESETNKGLAKSIVQGVTEVIQSHGKAIVLEDDLVTSTFFLRFMNDALTFYENDNRIFSIGGINYKFKFPKSYQYDIYLAPRTESCGWGTWKNRWEKAQWNNIDYAEFIKNDKEIERFNRGGSDMSYILQLKMEGKVDSWAIMWDYCLYKNNAYCLRPVKSFIKNIGFDGTGIHSNTNDGDLYSGNPYLKQNYDIKLIENIEIEEKIIQNFRKVFEPEKRILVKVMNKLKQILKS